MKPDSTGEQSGVDMVRVQYRVPFVPCLDRIPFELSLVHLTAVYSRTESVSLFGGLHRSIRMSLEETLLLTTTITKFENTSL